MRAMNKINFKYIYERTLQLLLKPESEWPHALEENNTEKEIFRNYLIPIALLTSVMVLLLSLLNYNFLQSGGLAIINLLSATLGCWFSYLITREYMCGKLSYENNQALNLTVYSAAIFIIFHSIGTALGSAFLGQLFTLFSFIFIRTLYKGLSTLPRLQTGQRTNILIIMSLSIICLPVIISQILTIVFGISAFNI